MVRFGTQCLDCLWKKHILNFSVEATEAEKLAYMQAALGILSKVHPSQSPPEVLADIEALQKERFGIVRDFSEEKAFYNNLMLKKEALIADRLTQTDAPLMLALRYAMLGNYIDFGALDAVEETKLESLVDDAEQMQFDETEFAYLQTDLQTAKRVVFLTDNCGEIVFDKLLIKTLLRLYPGLKVDVIVRGAPVLNDVTMSDALQVGIDKIADVTENGSNIAGTCLDKITPEARALIEQADVIFSKGQGNFETLRGARKNIYYLFLCKCAFFAEQFKVPQFTPMFLNDLRM